MSRTVAYLEQHGGFCPRSDLVSATSRRQVERALRRGSVVSLGRGRIGLPGLDDAVSIAHGLRGVLCRTSAALWHGWEAKTVPARPHVVVARGRHLSPQQQALAVVHRADLYRDDVSCGISTSVELTLEQCARHLPEDEALAIADSALRHGVPPATLLRVGRSARGPGAPLVRRVLARADGRAANPFESVLRHLALGVPGLHVVPQRVVLGSRQTVRPDLVDDDLRIVLEADSFEWHGGRTALAKDARRYNLLLVDGWLVLRFSWEDVMFDPGYVVDVLTSVTQMRTQVGRCPRCTA